MIDNAGNRKYCSVSITAKTQYRKNTCSSYYGYSASTPITSNSNCTDTSNNKYSAYKYRVCGKKEYGFASNSTASGTCRLSHGYGSASPSTSLSSIGRFSTIAEARNACKIALKNKCPHSAYTLVSSNCDTIKVLTYTTYTNYTAKACHEYKNGSWQDQYIAPCSTAECKVETKIVYSK